MTYILAVDLGGSSIRAAVASAEGEVGPVAARPLGVTSGEADRHEEDAERWWALFGEVAAEAIANAPAVDGIAITGATRTQILVDARGRPVRPALGFRDARAAAEVEAVAAALAPSPTYGPVNAWHPLARLLWLKRHEPDALAQARAMLEPKDFLAARLTGVAAGDPISLAALIAKDSRTIAADAFRALGLSVDLVPRLLPPTTPTGKVLPAQPAPFDRLAGVPVFMTAHDSWSAVLGIGALQPDTAYNISGTTEVFGLLSRDADEAPGLVTLPWSDDLIQSGGPMQAGADCLAWFVEAFGAGAPLDALVAELDTQPRQREAVLFLPYLAGERTPLWNPNARGLFFGIHRGHRRVDLLWSVLEGVAFANRQVLELAERAAGRTAAEIRIAGGGARLDAWCQARADITGRTIIRTAEREPGLLGAAICALVGVGALPGLVEAQQRLVRVERSFRPDPARAQWADAAYALFWRLQETCLPLYEERQTLTLP